MANSSVITVKINTVVDGAQQVGTMTMELGQLASAAQKAQRQMESISMAAVAQAADQLNGLLNQITTALDGLHQAYANQIEAETKLEVVMRQRMAATESDIQKIKDLTAAQQQLGIIGDDVQLAGAQQVATFLNQKQTLEILIPAMNNLLAQQKGLNATQGDAVSVANLLGKAMMGQVTALKKVGITFNEAEEAILKYGDEVQRASTLADVIRNNVGDMNAELAKTDVGKQKQLENTLGDIKEQLGALMEGARPFLTITAAAVTTTTGLLKLTSAIRALAVSSTVLAAKKKALALATVAWASTEGVATTITNSLTAAMGLSAVAANTLKLAIRGLLLVTGAGAAIVALTYIIEGLTTAFDSASSSADGLNEQERRLQEMTESINQQRSIEATKIKEASAALTLNISRLKTFNGTKAEEKKLVQEMNDTYGATLGYFSSVHAWYGALIKDSESYIKALQLEAEARLIANQIQQWVDRQTELYYNPDGSMKYYSTRNEREVVPVYSMRPGGGYIGTRPGAEIPNSSPYARAKAEHEELDIKIKEAKGRLDDLNAKLAGVTHPVRGAATPPVGQVPGTHGSGSSSSTTDEVKLIQDPKTLEEIANNKKYWNKQLEKVSTVADAAAINKKLEELDKQEKELRDAGKVLGPSFTENARTLKEFNDNIAYLENQLETATAEDAVEINRKIAEAQAGRDAILNAGTTKTGEILNENATTLKDIVSNIEYYEAQLESADATTAVTINQALKKWRDMRDAILQAGVAVASTDPVFNANARTLGEIEGNISALEKTLQTQTLEQAAETNQQIEYWRKLADAIKDAGKKGDTTFGKIKTGFDAVKNINSAISQMTSTLKSNVTIWEKLLSVVDATLNVFEGVSSAVALVNKLTKSASVATSATTATTTATTASAAATAASVEATTAATAATTAHAVAMSEDEAAIMGAAAAMVIKNIAEGVGITTQGAATDATLVEAAATGIATAATERKLKTDLFAATASEALMLSTQANIPAMLGSAAAAETEATAQVTAAAAKFFSAHAWIPWVGVGLGAAAVAAMLVSLKGLPKFADGGIAYGPTLGLFGEYAGARTNPEVVAPLDKLRSLIGPADAGTGYPKEIKLRMQGTDMVACIQKTVRSMNR